MPSFIPPLVYTCFSLQQSYKTSRKSRLQITSVIPSVFILKGEKKSHKKWWKILLFSLFSDLSLDSGILMGKIACRYDGESYEVLYGR